MLNWFNLYFIANWTIRVSVWQPWSTCLYSNKQPRAAISCSSDLNERAHTKRNPFTAQTKYCFYYTQTPFYSIVSPSFSIMEIVRRNSPPASIVNDSSLEEKYIILSVSPAIFFAASLLLLRACVFFFSVRRLVLLIFYFSSRVYFVDEFGQK